MRTNAQVTLHFGLVITDQVANGPTDKMMGFELHLTKDIDMSSVYNIHISLPMSFTKDNSPLVQH